MQKAFASVSDPGRNLAASDDIADASRRFNVSISQDAHGFLLKGKFRLLGFMPYDLRTRQSAYSSDLMSIDYLK